MKPDKFNNPKANENIHGTTGGQQQGGKDNKKPTMNTPGGTANAGLGKDKMGGGQNKPSWGGGQDSTLRDKNKQK